MSSTPYTSVRNADTQRAVLIATHDSEEIYRVSIELPRVDNLLSQMGRLRTTHMTTLLKIYYMPWQRPGKSDFQCRDYQPVPKILPSVSSLHGHPRRQIHRTYHRFPSLRSLYHRFLPSLGYVSGHKRIFWTFRWARSHRRRQRFGLGCLNPRACQLRTYYNVARWTMRAF